MTRASTLAVALLAAAGALRCADAPAQARGPSALQVQEEGQRIEYAPEESRARRLRNFPAMLGITLEEPAAPLAELDTAGRASKNQEQAAWLARLPGRFRLGGRAEKWQFVLTEGGGGAWVELGGDIEGIADCAAIGTGPGVHCLLNATWPVIEPIQGPASVEIMRPPQASLRVKVLRPAVLVLGLDPDTAQIRASMVSDDSMAHNWTGRLEANTLTAQRSANCVVVKRTARVEPPPCFQPLRIIAEPDGGTVAMVHRSDGVTVRLSLQRDPAAQAAQPMKTRKVR